MAHRPPATYLLTTSRASHTTHAPPSGAHNTALRGTHTDMIHTTYTTEVEALSAGIPADKITQCTRCDMHMHEDAIDTYASPTDHTMCEDCTGSISICQGCGCDEWIDENNVGADTDEELTDDGLYTCASCLADRREAEEEEREREERIASASPKIVRMAEAIVSSHAWDGTAQTADELIAYACDAEIMELYDELGEAEDELDEAVAAGDLTPRGDGSYERVTDGAII